MATDIISIFDCLDLEKNQKGFVFVLLPFKPNRTQVFENIIKPVVIKNGFQCWKADDFRTNTNKLNDIVRNIWKSEFIIADITGLNANVMYELGFSHAMKKEAIMIYEETEEDVESKLPFDVGYIETIKYKNDALGGAALLKNLEKTIEYVKGIIAKSKASEMKKRLEESEDLEYKHSVISNFQIRVRRIDYFTYTTITVLNSFKEQHYTLIDLMEVCRQEQTQENHARVTNYVKVMTDRNNYNYTFTKELINTSINFISNAWIVNKLLDYIWVFSLPLNQVGATTQFSFENDSTFFNLKESIERNLTDLDFCIDALNDERKLVSLQVLNNRKKDSQ